MLPMATLALLLLLRCSQAFTAGSSSCRPLQPLRRSEQSIRAASRLILHARRRVNRQQTPVDDVEVPQLGDEMLQDLRDFQQRSRAAAVDDDEDVSQFAQTSKEEGSGILNLAENVMSTLLVVDFFVVIAFLGWFLVGAALQSSQPAILLQFQGIFQPVVVPALSVLMAGSVLSGLIDKVKKKD